MIGKPIPLETKEDISDEDLLRDHQNLYATFKSRFLEASHQDLLDMCRITVSVCHSCRDEASGCQCWNDE